MKTPTSPSPAAPGGPQPPARLFPGIGKHHNLMDVGNFIAAMSSAEFANTHFTQARPFPDKNQMYPWAMSQTKLSAIPLRRWTSTTSRSNAHSSRSVA